MTRMNRTRAWGELFLCCGIVLAGFGLRLYGLGAQSLWYDETVSAFLARQDIPALIAHTARDIHPPAYYLLLHLWVRLAGDSEFALAFLSLVFGVLLVALVGGLTRRLLGRRATLWAMLFVAMSPYNVWYSQEVRMYTLGAALGVLSVWCVAAMARNRPAAVVGYVLCSATGLYVLYYYAFLLLALQRCDARSSAAPAFLARDAVCGCWRRPRSWCSMPRGCPSRGDRPPSRRCRRGAASSPWSTC